MVLGPGNTTPNPNPDPLTPLALTLSLTLAVAHQIRTAQRRCIRKIVGLSPPRSHLFTPIDMCVALQKKNCEH
jgi:hypothetical protein